jgi:hypothetical protein
MATRTLNYGAALAAIAVVLTASAPARANTILLDLINPDGQTDTPYSLTFNATDLLTTVSFAGYQVPASELATHIGVFLNGAGSNLLGGAWTFAPAALGSLVNTFNDGTGVTALQFAGTIAGSYDTFSQQFATAAGSSYTVNFLYTNSVVSSPSGFRVTTDGVAGVPEPATWAMMLMGFGGLGAMMRAARRQDLKPV